MRAADWKRLSKPCLESTGVDWRWTRSLAYLDPVDWVLNGLLVEGSSRRSGAFYLWMVQMPLLVPADGVVDLSWSRRYGGGTQVYDYGDPEAMEAISAAGLAVINNKREGRLVPDPPGGVDNVRMQEARAYGLLLAGDYESALEVLRRVSRYDSNYDWGKQIRERASSIEALIELGAAEDAKAQLREWRNDNCNTLGLSCA